MLFKALNRTAIAARKSVDFLAGDDNKPGYLHRCKVATQAGFAGHKVSGSPRKPKKEEPTFEYDYEHKSPEDVRAYIRANGLDIG